MPRVLPRSAIGIGLTMGTLCCPPIGGSTACAQSAGGGHGGAHGVSHVQTTPHPQIDLGLPDNVTDFMQGVSDDLNGVYDQYAALKKRLNADYNIDFAMPVSVFGQWGTPNGGPGVAEIVYSPEVIWTPFTDTPIGSGTFTFQFQGNQFWTQANTGAQQQRMGLLTPPNDWEANGYQFLQMTYTHSFPGNVLAVSVGQYSFSQFDGNEYAGNPQTNFINYVMAQNGTQAYANAGTGAYMQVTPTPQLEFAGGFQGATDIEGSTLTTSGLRDGSIAYFVSAQWTPKILAGGVYSILYYSQPAIPLQPSQSQGISFGATQNLDARYGVFLRVNNASGDAIPIETSVAFGGMVNDPFGRNHLDQAGIGVAWNKTNLAAIDVPARRSEQVAELYYSFTVFKAMAVTPDAQVYFNPALAPQTRVAAVFTLRTTFNF